MCRRLRSRKQRCGFSEARRSADHAPGSGSCLADHTKGDPTALTLGRSFCFEENGIGIPSGRGQSPTESRDETRQTKRHRRLLPVPLLFAVRLMDSLVSTRRASHSRTLSVYRALSARTVATMGNSVFLNAIVGIMGDYACVAAMDTFTAATGDKHPTDIAMLMGARLVTASETQSGRSWDEARVKSLTGGERISARFMRQDFFTYVPQFKLLFAGNHKPDIRDVDPAMRRRIQLVPFTVTPAQVDKELGAKLRKEWPAILARMIEGCLAWQEQGLAPPEAVTVTTEEYFAEQDSVTQWLNEDCELAVDSFTTLAVLYASWRERCNRFGDFGGTNRQLSQRLANRGFQRGKDPKRAAMVFAA